MLRQYFDQFPDGRQRVECAPADLLQKSFSSVLPGMVSCSPDIAFNTPVRDLVLMSNRSVNFLNQSA